MTEERLLRRLRHGKEDALERLIDQYSRYVVSILAAMLGRNAQEDIEELAADVFVSLWRHADSLRPGSVKAYLGVTTRNKAKDFLRRKAPQCADLDTIELPDLSDGPEADYLKKEQRKSVLQALLAMQHPDREIFLRYYYYYQTSQQIAEELGMNPATVRTRLARGRKALKQVLLEEENHEHENHGHA